jgi:hypothetical protein
MATKTKTENAEIKKLAAELLKLILDKTGMSYNSFIKHVKRDFILNNLDVITSENAKNILEKIQINKK